MADWQEVERYGLMFDAASGFLFLLLGVAVLMVRPVHRTRIAFGLFAIGFGCMYAFQNLVRPELAALDPWWGRLTLAGFIAAPTIVMVALWFPHPLRREERGLLWLPACLAALILITGSLLMLHPFARSLLAPWATTYAEAGATAMAFAASHAGLFFASTLWALRARRWSAHGRPGIGRIALLSLAVSAFLHSFTAQVAIGQPALRATLDGPMTVILLFSAALFTATLVLATVWLWGAHTAQPPDSRIHRNAGLAILAIMAVSAIHASLTDPILAQNLGINGLLRTGGVLIVAYLVVKQHLFDIDAKLKWTLSRGSVAAIFLIVFFVTATVASEFLVDRFGFALGGIAAGLLLFAIAPLQRAGEKLADAAMPNVRPLQELGDDERVSLYRDMVEAAWHDGVLTRAEGRVLEAAHRRLRLSPEQVLSVERAIRG